MILEFCVHGSLGKLLDAKKKKNVPVLNLTGEEPMEQGFDISGDSECFGARPHFCPEGACV